MEPTLLVPGSLKDYFGDEAKNAEYEKIRPIDWITERTAKMLKLTGMANRVQIIKAMTASGKSTALPGTIYTEFITKLGEKKRGLICTQPRVLTAIENIGEITPYFPSLVLGETIGWSTQYNKLRPARWGFLSATTGTLAAQLITMTDQEIMDRYKFIMIDEVHERSIEIDTVLYYLKKFMNRCKDELKCPMLFLMSATFEPEPLLKFFGVDWDNFTYVTGRAYPIETHWLNSSDRDTIYKHAAEIVREISTTDDAGGDILIFMVGKAEIDSTTRELLAILEGLPTDRLFSISALDSIAVKTMDANYYRAIHVPLDRQEVRIKDAVYKPCRRVIICTNVAETGLTLSNLKYVIDSGYNRQVVHFPNYSIKGLVTIPATLGSVQQRKGRAGRKFAGHFYPLYTEETAGHLMPDKFPNLIVDSATPLILAIISEQSEQVGHFDLSKDLDLVDLPSVDAIQETIEKLYLLGIIEFVAPPTSSILEVPKNMIRTTDIGKYAAILAQMIPVESIRMIFAGYGWGVSILDLITIAAYCTVKITRKPPKMSYVYSYAIGGMTDDLKPLLLDEFIDAVIIFKFIDKSLKNGEKNIMSFYYEQLARANITPAFAEEFLSMRDTIIMQCIALEMAIFRGASIFGHDDTISLTTLNLLKFCIYDGFRRNLVHLVDGKYKTLHGGLTVATPAVLHPLKEFPRYFVTYELDLKLNQKHKLYELTASRISILDGFIPVDLEYYI
jgi:HrpA-like RNA helicase